jgi:hypothetical protein
VAGQPRKYPTTQAERTRLADELRVLGLIPTQAKHAFDRDKIDAMVEAMLDGSFDWAASALQPVILGPGKEVLGGHHRVIAAHLAGIDLGTVAGANPQVRTLPVSYRPATRWIDVLPDVP